MKYRTLGRTGVEVSVLGFGAMRLPQRGREGEVDEPAAIELIRWAVDHGVNYVDTAYVYHAGAGEGVVGRALRDGYRQKVQLATKLPIWSVERLADCDRIFQEQLDRLQTDHIDFYLLHCLQKTYWPKLRDLGVLQWAERQQAAGRIRHFGFSFHDSYEAFVEIVDAYPWSCCQIQYNFVSEDVQAGTRGLQYAAAKGLGVIVMEPLFGGTLANPPPTVQRLWDSAGAGVRPPDVALRWVWDKPEVSLALSGMNALDQVRQNVASAERSGAGTLTADERGLLARVRDEYQRLSPIPCTKCGYCLPCPSGVNIPVNFELYNQATVFQGSSRLLCRNLYLSLPESERADACARCGTCEDRCPQHLPVAELLQRTSEHFAAADGP
ncbi:MAG: aldo/keto reductase [Candidatus Anammoximicrobium sp.]|nr:aldo/keto reductase [Candidatus Anammoximicrobium sp.]